MTTLKIQYKCCTDFANRSNISYYPPSSIPTSPTTTLTIGGTDVKATMTVPNKLIDKLASAAARGSETSSKAVAIAEELLPRATPRVT